MLVCSIKNLKTKKMKGKCKQDFEKWLTTEHSHLITLDSYFPVQSIEEYIFEFYNSHPSMQWGVIVDFFDSVGIKVIIGNGHCHYLFNYTISSLNKIECFDNEFKTRHEARAAAIEKATEIYNEKFADTK